MLPEQFYVIQQYLLSVFYPYLEFWLIVFLVGAVFLGVLAATLMLIRVGLTLIR